MKKYLLEVEACPKMEKVPVTKSSKDSVWLEFEDKLGYNVYFPNGDEYWCPEDLFKRDYKEV